MALGGLARGFYGPAMFGMMSDIVPREHYGNAIAWNATIWQEHHSMAHAWVVFFYIYFAAAKTYLFAHSFNWCICLFHTF